MSFLSRLLKFLNWSNSAKPEISLDTELYEQLKPFRFPLISVVLLLLFGTLGYIFIDNFSLIDAFYQAGMTFTTVGFTEVAPITPKGRIFYYNIYPCWLHHFYAIDRYRCRSSKKRHIN